MEDVSKFCGSILISITDVKEILVCVVARNPIFMLKYEDRDHGILSENNSYEFYLLLLKFYKSVTGGGACLDRGRLMGTSLPGIRSATTFLACFLLSNFTGVRRFS